MYVFKPNDIAEVAWLKRKKLWRFRLICGGMIWAAVQSGSQIEVLTASDISLDCPEGCTKECPVQNWEKTTSGE